MTPKNVSQENNYMSQLHRNAIIAEMEQADYEREGITNDPEEYDNDYDSAKGMY